MTQPIQIVHLVLTLCAGADCDEVRLPTAFASPVHCALAAPAVMAAAEAQLLRGERVAGWRCE